MIPIASGCEENPGGSGAAGFLKDLLSRTSRGLVLGNGGGAFETLPKVVFRAESDCELRLSKV